MTQEEKRLLNELEIAQSRITDMWQKLEYCKEELGGNFNNDWHQVNYKDPALLDDSEKKLREITYGRMHSKAIYDNWEEKIVVGVIAQGTDCDGAYGKTEMNYIIDSRDDWFKLLDIMDNIRFDWEGYCTVNFCRPFDNKEFRIVKDRYAEIFEGAK